MTNPNDDDPLFDNGAPAPRYTTAGTAHPSSGVSWMHTATQAGLDWYAKSLQTFLQVNENLWESDLALLKEFKRWAQLNPWYDWFQKWVDKQFTQFNISIGDGFYDLSKEMIEMQINNFLPEAVASSLKYEIISNPNMREIARSQGMIAALERAGNNFKRAGKLYEKKFNHQFLTVENKQIRSVSIEEIDALFPRANEYQSPQNDFPRLILTSSHARAAKDTDVTDITNGIQAMIEQSHEQPLPLLDLDEPPEHRHGKTLILMACDTERNALLNGASLLKRMNELKRLQRTGKTDTFEEVSLGAKRLAKLMLRCMAQKPEDVQMDDLRPLKEIGTSIQLRARPELIAQHFQLIGYSKGGNVVSDAMRYLIHDLTAQNGDEYLVQMNGHALSKPEHKEKVRDLVRNISCMAIAALEVPLTDREKELGLRRYSFTNEHDMIANHMPFEGTSADHRYIVKGVKQRAGHAPKDALGTLEGKKGYMIEDDRVARRVREVTAPLFGKATISSISFRDDDFTMDGSRIEDAILIGTAPGTSDSLFMKFKEKIEGALSTHRFPCEITEFSKQNRRSFVLKGPEGWRDDPRALQALYNGLAELRLEDGSGLVISDEIFQTIIPERVKHMKQKPGAPKTWKSFQLDSSIMATRGVA